MHVRILIKFVTVTHYQVQVTLVICSSSWVQKSLSQTTFVQYVCTVYYCIHYRVMLCCGAVYKSESHDLILIDVAKFKPCRRQHHGSLAHLTAVAREARIIDSSSHALISSSYNNSTDSLSTQDDESLGHCNHSPDEETNHSSLLPSSASASGEQDGDEEEYEDDDSFSALHTDESMDAASPSRDTDDEPETLPASDMAGTGRTILCNLLWNNGHSRPFGKSGNQESRPDFDWSELQPQSVNMWPSTHALSKPSPVKVYP